VGHKVFGESINCDKLTQILSVYAFGEFTNLQSFWALQLLQQISRIGGLDLSRYALDRKSRSR
jgi:hypothetical protein